MAAFDTNRATYAPAGFAGRIGRAVFGAAAAFNAWNDNRVTRKSLSGLSDRELDDIGLSREDIYNIR